MSSSTDTVTIMDDAKVPVVPMQAIVDAQVAWARSAGLSLVDHHQLTTVDENLFRPLHPATRQEFVAGAGSELGKPGEKPPMASLRSSAALAVNFFDAWRGRDLAPLTNALGVGESSDLWFERKFPTGLRGTPPHLDVVLDGAGVTPTAIECKFAEIYGQANNKFKDSYFATPDIWKGLDNARLLAIDLVSGDVSFERLGAAQLIKHSLGLTGAFGIGGFRLVYLWFRWPGSEADRHQAEVDRFAEIVGHDFAFEALTYQDLFKRLSGSSEPQPGYLDYLADRYFAG